MITQTLQEIGLQLDQDVFPRIYNGGVVRPRTPTVIPLTQGRKANSHEQARQRAGRPATGPRTWTAGRPWASSGRRSGSPSAAASLVYPNLWEELDAVHHSYPDTRVWLQDEGVWLLTKSRLLQGLWKQATFLTAIPFNKESRASSWAFWTSLISIQWIGPRHTNYYPNGSICAFELKDGTWVIGDNILKLLDLYSLWALRHLHLEMLGRWPGQQFVHHPYERLTELHDDELCGCENPQGLYEDCCKPVDLSCDFIKQAFDYWKTTREVKREPPQAIRQFVENTLYHPLPDELPDAVSSLLYPPPRPYSEIRARLIETSIHMRVQSEVRLLY